MPAETNPDTGPNPPNYEYRHAHIQSLIEEMHNSMYPRIARQRRLSRGMKESSFGGLLSLHSAGMDWGSNIAERHAAPILVKTHRLLLERHLRWIDEYSQTTGEPLPEIMRLDRVDIVSALFHYREAQDKLRYHFPGFPLEFETSPVGEMRRQDLLEPLGLLLIWLLAPLLIFSRTAVEIVSFIPLKLLPSLLTIAEAGPAPEAALALLSLAFFAVLAYALNKVWRPNFYLRYYRHPWKWYFFISGGLCVSALALIAPEIPVAFFTPFFQTGNILSPALILALWWVMGVTGEFLGALVYLAGRFISGDMSGLPAKITATLALLLIAVGFCLGLSRYERPNQYVFGTLTLTLPNNWSAKEYYEPEENQKGLMIISPVDDGNACLITVWFIKTNGQSAEELAKQRAVKKRGVAGKVRSEREIYRVTYYRATSWLSIKNQRLYFPVKNDRLMMVDWFQTENKDIETRTVRRVLKNLKSVDPTEQELIDQAVLILPGL